MTGHDREPVLPWQIPMPVIGLLIVVIVAITLTGLWLAWTLAIGGAIAGGRGLDLSWPDTPMGVAVWIQGGLAIAALFLVWLFAILVVGAYAGGSHRNAAINAVAMVRVSIVIMVVRFTANAAVPVIMTGSWTAGLTILGTGAPLMLAQIALLIAADAYFCAVRENAPS